MSKTVLFVLLEQWADWEIAYLSSALGMLTQGQYSTKTVALTKDCVKSIGGINALPDYDIDTIPSEYDALILIGGMSWRTESAKNVKALVMKCLEDKKVLGAICDASVFLGSIGVLNNIKHTSNDINDLKQYAGAKYTNDDQYIREQAVSDNNIITANGTAALEFAKEVMITLNVASDEKINEWYNFHKLGYYNVPYVEWKS